MLNKITAAALVATFAVPAFASEINPGREMQAKLLGLSAAEFSTSELAQIASEKNDDQRASRAAYIVSQRGTASAVAHDSVYNNDEYRGHDN